MWYATERIKRKKWGDKSIPLKCWVTAHSGLCWESTVLFSLTIEIQANAQWKHPAAAARASSRKLSVLQRCRLAPDTGGAERPTGCKGGGGRWRGSYSYSPGLNQAFTTCLKITERARRREERDRVCAHIHRGECAEWRKVARLLNENLCVCVCVCVCVLSSGQGGRRKDSVHCVLVYIRPQAKENSSAQHEDGGSPAEPVAPVELVVGLKNRPVDELDGIEDQSAGLQDHWNQSRVKHESLSLNSIES